MAESEDGGQDASRFKEWIDPTPLIDLSDRLGRTQPWADRTAVERELRDWLDTQGAAWQGLKGREADVADGLWLLGRSADLPDSDTAARITFFLFGNAAAGRDPTEYDLLADAIKGLPERSLRRYRDAPRARLDTAIRRFAILGWADADIATEVGRDPRLGTAGRDLMAAEVRAILDADPFDPVEPLHRFLVSFQRRLDVDGMVRAGWKAQSARQWLRRHPGSHAKDAGPGSAEVDSARLPVSGSPNHGRSYTPIASATSGQVRSVSPSNRRR